jgi:hypothetical protein
MRIALICIVGLLGVSSAIADEAAECAAGIDMIKGEIAKGPTGEKAESLNKFVADAERELGEKEYDECFEAIEDAKEVAEK